MILVIFMGGYVTLKLIQINRLTRDAALVDSATVGQVDQLFDTLFTQVSFEEKYLISKDRDFYNKFWEVEQNFLKDIGKLESLLQTPDDNQLFVSVKASYKKYLSLFQQQVLTLDKNPDQFPWQYHNAKNKLIDTINQDLRKLIKQARSDRDKKIGASNRIVAQVLKTTLIIVGLAIIAGLIISYFNTRHINRPILLLKAKTKEIADSKFTRIANITSPPEIKELADDFNMMCERLKELDEMKEDFINRVSHKLRTPLTAIREATRMLLDGSYAKDPEKQKELLKITKIECERLIHSVNRILDLSRMEADMMDFTFKKRNLVPVIQKTVLKLAPIARKKKIDLELKPPGKLPKVWIDEERVAQVVENLLGNALKFTAGYGKVIIQTCVKNNAKKFLEVSILDNGCGVPGKDLATIFDKFKRVGTATNRVGGTGLGLSIAKYIVSSHGGKIWVKSKPGKGSIFSFSLPVL
ncbi:MAG: HAMP domain-containing histidine kinase, partial [Desulfobacterales bacterium]|nr:HAMP domain-containing histidine kinase [Desulfobacterales bacterium]